MVDCKGIRFGVVVVAAGSGTRYGSCIPKQFADLCGKPVLRHSLDTFATTLPKVAIVVVLSSFGMDWWNTYCEQNKYDVGMVVLGGASRGESVKCGINALRANGLPEDACVMVHDGARPLLQEALIERLTEAMATGFDGAVPALDITDSMVQLDPEGKFTPVPRSSFRTVQTPQVFRLGALLEAYTIDGHENYTDDLSLMLAAGFDNIMLVQGQTSNIKVTHRTDLDVAATLLAFD